MKRAIILFLISLFLSCQSPDKPMTKAERSAIEKIIIAKHQKMSESSSHLDADAVWSHFVGNDSGIFAIEGKLTLSRDEALNSARTSYGNLKEMHTKMQQEYATVLSPESAVFTGTGIVDGVLKSGDSFEVPFAITVVYVLRDGDWKAIHMHESTPNMPEL